MLNKVPKGPGRNAPSLPLFSVQRMGGSSVSLLLVISFILSPSVLKVSAQVITLNPGDIILASAPPENAVYKLDPKTGNLQKISSPGDEYNFPFVAFKYGGDGRVTDIFITNYSPNEILRLDPKSGARTTLISNVMEPCCLVVDGNGDILVTLEAAGFGRLPGVYRIKTDPVHYGEIAPVSAGGIFNVPFGLAIEGDGKLIVTDLGTKLVVLVDPAANSQTVLSSDPFNMSPVSVAIDSNGNIIITEIMGYDKAGAVSRFDPVSGIWTRISTGVFPSGATPTPGSFGLETPWGLALENDGNILVADWCAYGHNNGGAVIRINPTTGEQSLVCNDSEPNGLAVVKEMPSLNLKQAKNDTIDILNGISTSGNKWLGDRIANAKEHIIKSLKAEYWEDDSHLTKKGKNVFEEEKNAIHELQEILKKKDIAEAAKSAVQNAINNLVDVDKALAQTAIDDAIATGADGKEITNALKEMDKAQEELDKGKDDKYDNVIEHYKNAWEHAQKAMKKVIDG